MYVIRHKTECNRNEIMDVINSKKTHKITYIVDDDRNQSGDGSMIDPENN